MCGWVALEIEQQGVALVALGGGADCCAVRCGGGLGRGSGLDLVRV